MDHVTVQTVICQVLGMLPLHVDERLLFDHYSKKLTVMKSILIFIAAQLNRWTSYREMEFHIRAQPELQRLFRLESISGSQLSRKLDQLPTELLSWLFHELVVRSKQRSADAKGISERIGKLHIIDSTSMRLPLQLGDWARMSSKASGVKMHLRLVAATPDQVVPDAMVPSTLNVNDRVGAVELVTDTDATYVLDRGYDNYGRMDQWIEDQIRFVMRVRDRTTTTILEEYPVRADSRILRDAKVQVGSAFRSMKQLARLVEYEDDQGRRYRVLTSIWDLSAEEIAHIYKCRWLIELYFKHLKQHLKLSKLCSYKPQAIWNQLFLVLITALLVDECRAQSRSSKSPGHFLKLLRVYMYHPFSALMTELERVPSKRSQGRSPGGGVKPKTVRTTMGLIKPSKWGTVDN